MSGENYYLITALDVPGELGEEPPMSPSALLEHVSSNRRAQALVSAVFLGDDLLQREALQAGEIQTPEPVVLAPAQLTEELPLPEFLTAQSESHLKIPGDALWANYYHYVDRVARREGSDLLGQWVGYEVALRNGLVEARSAALGLEASEYTVAEDLAEGGTELAATLNEWSAADTPLSALRVLDRARWAWIELHTPTFSFDDDELVAYAIRLMLLCRWHRMAQPQQGNQTN
jgi:hypothetical protein